MVNLSELIGENKVNMALKNSLKTTDIQKAKKYRFIE